MYVYMTRLLLIIITIIFFVVKSPKFIQEIEEKQQTAGKMTSQLCLVDVKYRVPLNHILCVHVRDRERERESVRGLLWLSFSLASSFSICRQSRKRAVSDGRITATTTANVLP